MRRGTRRWGAVAAAYLLVVQSTLAGLALGAHAAPAVGPSGDMICSSAGDVAPERDGREALADCRLPGCLMTGAVFAPAPEETRVEQPRAAAFGAAAGCAPDGVMRDPERSPRTTRAPPPAT